MNRFPVGHKGLHVTNPASLSVQCCTVAFISSSLAAESATAILKYDANVNEFQALRYTDVGKEYKTSKSAQIVELFIGVSRYPLLRYYWNWYQERKVTH